MVVAAALEVEAAFVVATELEADPLPQNVMRRFT